jgi:hypothetical protein
LPVVLGRKIFHPVRIRGEIFKQVETVPVGIDGICGLGVLRECGPGITQRAGGSASNHRFQQRAAIDRGIESWIFGLRHKFASRGSRHDSALIRDLSLIPARPAS